MKKLDDNRHGQASCYLGGAKQATRAAKGGGLQAEASRVRGQQAGKAAAADTPPARALTAEGGLAATKIWPAGGAGAGTSTPAVHIAFGARTKRLLPPPGPPSSRSACACRLRSAAEVALSWNIFSHTCRTQAGVPSVLPCCSAAAHYLKAQPFVSPLLHSAYSVPLLALPSAS